MTYFDVLRHLCRTTGIFRDGEQQREALLAVDAHEQGYNSAEEWQAELDRRAQAAEPAPAPAAETDAQRAARLEAELERIKAEAQAAAGR